MELKKKKEVVFLLMEHNFIDQITPIIELLYKNNYKITLVKVVHNYNYSNDNNLKYIKINFPNIVTTDMFLDSNKLYKRLHSVFNFFDLKLSLTNSKVLRLLYTFSAGITRRVLIALKMDINSINFLIDSFHSSDCIFISDVTKSDLNYVNILDYLKKNNRKHIAFHHSFYIMTNRLTTYSNINFSNLTKLKSKSKLADKVVAYNTNSLKTLKETLTGDIIKLPSLRYSTKWIDKIKESRITFNPNNENKLKIVCMLSHHDYNTWEDELFRTINMLLTNLNIFLVVKIHPRSIRIKNKFLQFKQENFFVASNDISSSSIIDWSDIVMVMSSGIVMEAIIKRKPIFYMKYLHCNEFTAEFTKNIIHTINTRDELVRLVTLYQENKKQNFIDEEEVKEFLKDYICNDDYEENQQKYLKLFEDLQ